MLKGVYDIRIILGIPAAAFVCLTILVLIAGPILIRRAYYKKGQKPPPLSDRCLRCFWAELATFVCSYIGLLILSLPVVVFGYAIPDTMLVEIVVLGIVAIILIFFIVWLVLLSAKLCVPSVEDSDLPHPLGKRRVLSVGILIVACVGVCYASWLPILDALGRSEGEYTYRENLKGIGFALVVYKTEHRYFPDHLGQLIDEGEVSCEMFRLPNNWDSIEAAEERHKKGESAKTPPDFHYVKLPKNAPGDLLWVWPDPKPSMLTGFTYSTLMVPSSISCPTRYPPRSKRQTIG